MRIAICDDEVSMVQILEEKIKKLLPDAVIEKYLSGDELIASGRLVLSKILRTDTVPVFRSIMPLILSVYSLKTI